ncbi:MAG: DUF4157 domain-containing protein [Chloroflexi bacterium]|nr:DUF4157 domain-containing protein [Chloroflexota bacterium]
MGKSAEFDKKQNESSGMRRVRQERPAQRRERNEEQPSIPARVTPEVLKRLGRRAPNHSLRRLVGEQGGTVPEQEEDIIQREVGRGQPLAAATRTQMSSALGKDLTDVRIHTDPTADVLAGEMGARAFTVGSDIFFASGEYQPATSGGQRIIAHELAHVTQADDTPQAKLRVGAVDDPAEADAEKVANRVMDMLRTPRQGNETLDEEEQADSLRRQADKPEDEEGKEEKEVEEVAPGKQRSPDEEDEEEGAPGT